jgi:hypothetical protein
VTKKVVDVDAFGRQKLVFRAVANREANVCVRLGVNHERLGTGLESTEHVDEVLGLYLCHLELVDDDDATFFGELGERGGECRSAHLSRRSVAPITGCGRVSATAAYVHRRSLGAVTCVAGTLLLVHLLAATGDRRAVLGAGSALAARCKLCSYDFVEEVLAHFHTEDFIGKIDCADLFAFQIEYVDGCHLITSRT